MRLFLIWPQVFLSRDLRHTFVIFPKWYLGGNSPKYHLSMGDLVDFAHVDTFVFWTWDLVDRKKKPPPFDGSFYVAIVLLRLNLESEGGLN